MVARLLIIGLVAVVAAVPDRVSAQEATRPQGGERLRKRASASRTQLRSGEAAILAALDEKTEMEFENAPLDAVLAYLRDRHRINIVLDKKSLDQRIASDTLVTKNVSNVTLRSALNLLLRDLDLAWTIRDAVLLITTRDEAAENRITRVYDVGDLVGCGDVPGAVPDYDSLVDVITSTIAPGSWEGSGPVSDIQGYMLAHTTVLVVRQTLEAHEEIAKLLADIRAAAARQSLRVAELGQTR